MTLVAEWVVPVTSPPLHRHAIEIKNGKIHTIRPLTPQEKFLPGSCLLPGLINSHTHLAYTGFRNILDHLSFFPWIRRLTELKYNVLTEEDIRVSTQLGILECLRSGITCVADLADLEESLCELSKSPLRGIFYFEIFGVEKDQAEKSWNDWLRNYQRYLEKYVTEKLQLGISPHACYTVRPELYRRVAEWSITNEVPVSFHAAESREEEEFIGWGRGPIADYLRARAADWTIHGKTSIQHLAATSIFQARPLLAHLVQARGEDLDLLEGFGVSVAHCPKSNAKFGHGIAPITQMISRGFAVGIATDSAASNNRLDLFEEARFALLIQRAGGHFLSEQQVLEMITIGAARAMGLDHQIGSLEAGKEADVIEIRIPPYYASGQQVLYHLVHNATGRDVVKTWIHGEEIQVPDIDEEVASLYKRISSSI